MQSGVGSCRREPRAPDAAGPHATEGGHMLSECLAPVKWEWTSDFVPGLLIDLIATLAF